MESRLTTTFLVLLVPSCSAQTQNTNSSQWRIASSQYQGSRDDSLVNATSLNDYQKSSMVPVNPTSVVQRSEIPVYVILTEVFEVKTFSTVLGHKAGISERNFGRHTFFVNFVDYKGSNITNAVVNIKIDTDTNSVINTDSITNIGTDTHSNVNRSSIKTYSIIDDCNVKTHGVICCFNVNDVCYVCIAG